MRSCVKSAVLFLCAVSAFAQCEKRIDGPPNFKVRTLEIEGLESLPSSESDSMRQALTQLCFSNAKELGERARDLFQQHGYFKATVEHPRMIVKDDHPWPAPADVLLVVYPGVQYRLRAITFFGNKAVANAVILRKLFPLRDGEVLDVDKLRDGIKALKRAYAELGFINFTPIPDFTFDEEHKFIALKINVDEGKQFFVEQVDIRATSEVVNRLVDSWYTKVGDLYNGRAVELFFLRNRRLLSKGATPERDVSYTQDADTATLKIHVDVCSSARDCVIAYVPCRPDLVCTKDSAGIPEVVGVKSAINPRREP